MKRLLLFILTLTTLSGCISADGVALTENGERDESIYPRQEEIDRRRARQRTRERRVAVGNALSKLVLTQQIPVQFQIIDRTREASAVFKDFIPAVFDRCRENLPVQYRYAGAGRNSTQYITFKDAGPRKHMSLREISYHYVRPIPHSSFKRIIDLCLEHTAQGFKNTIIHESTNRQAANDAINLALGLGANQQVMRAMGLNQQTQNQINNEAIDWQDVVDVTFDRSDPHRVETAAQKLSSAIADLRGDITAAVAAGSAVAGIAGAIVGATGAITKNVIEAAAAVDVLNGALSTRDAIKAARDMINSGHSFNTATEWSDYFDVVAMGDLEYQVGSEIESNKKANSYGSDRDNNSNQESMSGIDGSCKRCY